MQHNLLIAKYLFNATHSCFIMAGNSNVGTRTIYESNEQRNITRSEVENARRNRDNPPDSNRRGSAHEKEQKSRGKHSPTDDELAKIDPTAPVSPTGDIFFK